MQKAVQWGMKEGKAQIFELSRRLFLWKAHLKYWSGTTITPTPTRLPARSWCCQSRAKLGSSTKARVEGLVGGLETSNLRGNFTGLQVTFLFRLLEEERILLSPGGPRSGAATGTYSTRPSATTSDILTPGLEAASFLGVPPWYQRSLVSLAVRRCNTTRS